MPNKHHPPHHPTPPPRALMRLSATHSPLPFPPSHARVRIHYSILLPFFPAPSRAGIIPSFFRPPRPQFPPIVALIGRFYARKQLFSHVFSKNLRKYLVEWKSRRTFAPANEKGTPLRRRGCNLRSLREPRSAPRDL